MKVFIKLYHFLGSLYFALILISLTAFFVAVGTILEAKSESHLFSASWTYQHPFFLALIWGFFFNILISALRRWPFEKKHLPFLMTHLGLLMLLGGVIIKSSFGRQGSMSLMEGSATSRIFIPHSHSLHLEKKDPEMSGKKILIDQELKKILHADDLEIRLLDFAPHSSEYRRTWIKDQQLVLVGLKPIEVQKNREELASISGTKVRLHHKMATPWKILAVSTHQVSEIAKQEYLKGLMIQISHLADGKIVSKRPLSELLEKPLQLDKETLFFSLTWNFSTLRGLESPSLNIDRDGKRMEIALSGSDSLINQKLSGLHGDKIPLIFDLYQEPIFLCVQDDYDDNYLFFFNAHGEIHSTYFKNDSLSSIMVYDDGFGGYSVQTVLPFEDFSSGRYEKEEAELFRIAVQLRQSLAQNASFVPPLNILKKYAEEAHRDFAEVIVRFLQAWENSSRLLFDPVAYAPALVLDWSQIPQKEQYACGWLCLLLDEMEIELKKGKNFSQILEEKRWPLQLPLSTSSPEDSEIMITQFAQQIFAAAAYLPHPEMMPDKIPMKALSAYLRAYGITLNSIRQPLETHQLIRTYHAARLFHDRVGKILSLPKQEDQPTAHVKLLAHLIESLQQGSPLFNEIKKAYLSFQIHVRTDEINEYPTASEISQIFMDYAPLDNPHFSTAESALLAESLDSRAVVMESPLRIELKKAPSLQKWEDNRPLITLEIKKGDKKEYLSLSYDPYGTGLAWPIFNGEYLLRYQPLFIDLPYKVRLHDARQINHPGTVQPFSYESDIIVTDLRDQSHVEKTISMNNVYETKEGYRFYLASLSPSDETEAQRVQIIVNYDPVKYLLTYPGALIMTFGIVFLFWIRPYRKKE